MSSRKYLQERRQKEKQQNRNLTFLIGGGVILVVAALVYAVISSKEVNLRPKQIIQPEFLELDQFGLSGLGDPQAPVEIEVYSDFSCLHCADFALETNRLLADEYIKTGQVSLVFRTVGNLAEAPALQQAAEAAYCAGEQGSFWHFHDLIFANQVRLFTNRAANVSGTMRSFAEILALDIDQFEQCVEEWKYQELVAENWETATQLGTTGTPTFFINNLMLRGNQPYENFQAVIDQALAATQ